MAEVIALDEHRRPPTIARRAVLVGVALAVLLVGTCAAVTRLVGYDADGLPTRPLRTDDLLAIQPAGTLVFPASTGVERTGVDEVDAGGTHRAAEIRTQGTTVVTPDVVLDFYRRSLRGWSVADASASSLELRHGREDFRVEVAGSTSWTTTFAVAPSGCGTRLSC